MIVHASAAALPGIHGLGLSRHGTLSGLCYSSDVLFQYSAIMFITLCMRHQRLACVELVPEWYAEARANLCKVAIRPDVARIRNLLPFDLCL